MVANMWDERYAVDDYVYGREPNTFFKGELLKYLPGKVLFAAEGEGRNAVFAAANGWDVVAFDSSRVAKEKALRLAVDCNVTIDYVAASFDTFTGEPESFDAIVLIYAHTDARHENHRKLLQFLKPGGVVILEGFSKDQLNFRSGGPRNEAMLFSETELRDDFSELSEIAVRQQEVNLAEGSFHSGKASVIRLTGKK